jgi:hypothetical protein
MDGELEELFDGRISSAKLERLLDTELEKLLNEHIASVERLQGGLDIRLAAMRRHYKRFNKGVGSKSDALTHMLSAIDDVQEFLLLIARHVGTMQGVLSVQEIKELNKYYANSTRNSVSDQ